MQSRSHVSSPCGSFSRSFLFGLVFATAGVHASSALHGPQLQGPRLSFLRTPLALAASVFVIAAAYVVDSCAPATDLKLLKSRN